MQLALSWSRKFDGEPSEKVIRNYFDPSENKVTKNSYPKNAKFCGSMIAGQCFVLDGACKFSFKDYEVVIRAGEFAHLPKGQYDFEVVGETPVTLVKVAPLPDRATTS